ncbi:hypothetical protein SELMODRAFT_415685 [Selaginella moellendorffii]|uniref:Uncharacterized protein n=1 Tax=Selaginella moellendorffii TaxID=88036 RepID=D8RWX4_SELML|nr:hypothetical protein SELMODRAFT_415685 [Selaginella moellendorffii]
MRKRSMQESSEEEEEEQRLRSCVVDYSSLTPSAARPIDRQVEEGAADDHHLKFYQVRLQDHLHEFLDKTVEIIRAEEEPDRPVAAPSQEEDDGFHLFRKAPAGITMIERVRDGSLEHRASGKRYIHSTRGWFSSGKNSLENVVIDGESVRVEAEKAREKALAAWKDRISRKEEAIARENSRVAALKQVREREDQGAFSKEQRSSSLILSLSRFSQVHRSDAHISSSDITSQIVKGKKREKEKGTDLIHYEISIAASFGPTLHIQLTRGFWLATPHDGTI